MGLTARLQDERGKPESEGDIGIDFRIPTGDPSFRVLCYIDPHGTTGAGGNWVQACVTSAAGRDCYWYYDE